MNVVSEYITILPGFVMVAAGVFAVIGIIRNNVVYNIRIKILLNLDLDDFNRLPPYQEMVFHPKHWLMWTTEAYIKKYIE